MKKLLDVTSTLLGILVASIIWCTFPGCTFIGAKNLCGVTITAAQITRGAFLPILGVMLAITGKKQTLAVVLPTTLIIGALQMGRWGFRKVLIHAVVTTIIVLLQQNDDSQLGLATTTGIGMLSAVVGMTTESALTAKFVVGAIGIYDTMVPAIVVGAIAGAIAGIAKSTAKALMRDIYGDAV